MAAVAVTAAVAAVFAAVTADISNIGMKPPAPLTAEAPVPVLAEKDPSSPPHLRRRRMNYFDLANLLDQDGNLQNEMMVFAFAATMLSTIPILLGNEFDVNVGLRRRKREQGPQDHYGRYAEYDPSSGDGFTEMTYVKLMQETANSTKHKHNTKKDPAVKDPSMGQVVQDLLMWSKQKLNGKSLIGGLVDLFIAKIQGHKDPSDKMVRKLYKLWYGL
ncbi:uncharacterized protein LOC143036504 [Oratosquilla oratoria]|uniref:uncharacterized protein LOC143036504 n=1 Tax=Oratosquilla oratoria TaxID=337810 RepID=UPI003F776D3A